MNFWLTFCTAELLEEKRPLLEDRLGVFKASTDFKRARTLVVAPREVSVKSLQGLLGDLSCYGNMDVVIEKACEENGK